MPDGRILATWSTAMRSASEVCTRAAPVRSSKERGFRGGGGRGVRGRRGGPHLDGVRGRDEDHRGAAVDEVQLCRGGGGVLSERMCVREQRRHVSAWGGGGVRTALIQRDGEVLCGGVDPWVEHQEDRALVRLHHLTPGMRTVQAVPRRGRRMGD